MTALLLVSAAVYGLVIGSFLNVVIYRVPNAQSVVKPPSACPGCGKQIRARDNVPVLSWLVLRGRCRNCQMRISVRYPLVELLTGGVFVVVALRFGWSWSLPAEIIFVAGLITLAFIDLDHMLLPRRIVYAVGLGVGLALILAAFADHDWHRLAIAGLCAGAEFVLLFAINMISPRSLGFGDVRFGPVIALALGWLGWRYAFLGFLAANFLGAVVGIALIALKRVGRRTPIPFGVFLSIGAFVTMIFGGAVHYPA